jgi:hypothetical protein
MMGWLRDWILGVVVGELQVGAHCGLCGEWISDELTYKAWPFSVCRKCIFKNVLAENDAGVCADCQMGGG